MGLPQRRSIIAVVQGAGRCRCSMVVRSADAANSYLSASLRTICPRSRSGARVATGGGYALAKVIPFKLSKLVSGHRKGSVGEAQVTRTRSGSAGTAGVKCCTKYRGERNRRSTADMSSSTNPPSTRLSRMPTTASGGQSRASTAK